jgi:hypothetical protein
LSSSSHWSGWIGTHAPRQSAHFGQLEVAHSLHTDPGPQLSQKSQAGAQVLVAKMHTSPSAQSSCVKQPVVPVVTGPACVVELELVLAPLPPPPPVPPSMMALPPHAARAAVQAKNILMARSVAQPPSGSRRSSSARSRRTSGRAAGPPERLQQSSRTSYLSAEPRSRRVIRCLVLLFQKRFHAGLCDGTIRVTFRRWEKPHVKPGGRYRCHPIGVLEVDRIGRVRAGDIDEADARLGGFASRAELLEYLGRLGDLDDGTEVFRVELHWGGDGDRVEIALDDRLAPADVESIRKKLARLDEKGRWTARTLALIEKHPRVAASKLAAQVGRDTLPFKVDVRKLKRLGLTQSFEVGYEISPRGRAYLAARRKKRR